jgi:hypothetical protein
LDHFSIVFVARKRNKKSGIPTYSNRQSDIGGKFSAMMGLSQGIEILRRNIQDLGSRRSEGEQHDTNSAEALLRVGATHIAEAQWRKITLQLQEMTLRLGRAGSGFGTPKFAANLRLVALIQDRLKQLS